MTAAAAATVVIVDDEPAVLRALERFARREGYRVLAISDPQTLPALVEREAVDVVLSDVDMPGIDGLALVAWLRREHPRIVRLLLSGRASLPAAIQAINEGEVFRFLTKPCGLAELRAVLGDAAARARLARQPDPRALSERRGRLLAALEAEHPGITAVARPDGRYHLDLARVARTAAALEAPELVRLLTRKEHEIAAPRG